MSYTKAEYEAASQKLAASERFWKKHARVGRGGGRSLEAKYADKDPASNEDRSLVEVCRFENLDAGKNGYGAYWSKDGRTITTWMGEPIATIIWKGSEYKTPAFGGRGSKRINFRAKGIDGHLYSGTYFTSSGDYVQMKRLSKRS